MMDYLVVNQLFDFVNPLQPYIHVKVEAIVHTIQNGQVSLAVNVLQI